MLSKKFSAHIAFAIVLLTSDLSFAQASLSLKPNGGPPTTTVTVSGSGYTPYSAIDVYFDTKDVGLAVADGNGSFSNLRIKTTSSAEPGKHWVSGVQRSGD